MLRAKNNRWRVKLSPPLLSRGDTGTPCEWVYRVILDDDEWRKATRRDRYEDTCWGIFDPEWGWFPFWGFIDD